MADEQAAAAQDNQQQQQFAMQRIYNKDVSFESPATPDVFRKQWQPKINVDLNTKSNAIDEEGNFEVVLTITLTAKIEEETAFLVEVQQAGIFFITGFEGENLRRLLGTAAPNVLFPYARENIDSLVVKGGFPAIMLSPVNFDALYQQAVAQSESRAQQPADGNGETATH
ncbi:MAG: protein-export chaperone SecB [Chromatocurvus sp.]